MRTLDKDFPLFSITLPLAPALIPWYLLDTERNQEVPEKEAAKAYEKSGYSYELTLDCRMHRGSVFCLFRPLTGLRPDFSGIYQRKRHRLFLCAVSFFFGIYGIKLKKREAAHTEII